MGTNDQNLHILILPYFTPSHMISLVDTGRLLAAHGVTVTIITTTHNALLFRSSINQDLESGHQISVHELTFPSKEVGLPEGIENFNAITSNEMPGGLPPGFEGKMAKNNKGLIVREWVPQVKILDHPSTGGFLTHCGWNSVLEAFVAGVPLVTWPLFAEQFYNERLVELLRVGVKVGADVWNSGFEIESPLVGREMIENALSRLMDGSDESLMFRRRAKEIGVMARGAVMDGGSSFDQVTDLIEKLKTLI